MDCREATRKCAEWKHKFKGARTELQQVKMRLNVETDRADRAERDKLRSDAENALLRQALEDEREARLKSDDRSARLARRVKELEKINKIHDNAHTPSSKMTYTQKMIAAKKNRDRPKSGRKQGAQKGHPGKTSKPEPTEFEEHTMSECPNCGSDSIKNTGQKTRNVTETPPPAEPVTTRHTINVYECCRCGQKGMEPDAGLPSAGELGRNACGRVVSNFDDRLTHRMNARRMGRDGLAVSVGTVSNVLARTGRNMKPFVEAMILAMQRAGVLHIDETSFKLNGELVWVWIFLDPLTGNSLFVVRPSRGRDVLRDVLPGFRGVIVCDGWRSYNGWRRQRCWAHILREARYLLRAHPDSAAARDILERLRGVFETACGASGKRMSKARRARVRAALLGHVRRIIDDNWGSSVSRPFLGKLEGAADDLFAFVLDPRIQPTNNAAERGLREIVIHRKIRGSLRAEESMEIYGNIFTCIATWKNQGLDYVKELLPYA